MSLPAPVRRLPIRCLYAPPIRTTPIQHQRRNASSDSTPPKSNPILDKFRQDNPDETAQPLKKEDMPEGMGASGDISNTSIFEDDSRLQVQKAREDSSATDEDGQTRVGGVVRDPKSMARVINPNPRARELWEKRKVIQMVRKGGRLSRQEFLKRTEREHLLKSHSMKTSVKKLGMLARQIAGKTVEDAIIQMRFSSKKVAIEVRKQLEAARDEAIVMRGMGLGKVEAEGEEPAKKERPVEIQLKDGKRHRITDRSNIYIDQAWVNRMPYGKLPEYRARGNMNILRTPWTSLSVVLKEETTRVREYEEREAKRAKQIKEKVWTAMPDRPIQTQRQWYSW